VGLPSQLLERRPDVAAAERTMASANAQIGIAYAAYYPALTLGGEGGQSSSMFQSLANAANRLWSIGPSVSETVFDAGLRRATIDQYVATYNADLASYRQTVLTAFQQVEDYLAQVRILSKQLGQQRAAEASAEEYLRLETNRYQTGIDPYVDVTVAQTTLLQDQTAVINVQISEMTGAVQLIKALGGGWDVSQLPTPKQVTKPLSNAETTIQH
jgi:NodT family efflux transporter outer membrane factor (OMF) lipoprotein